MEDSQIVALYWERNELAIAETAAKYGRYCYAIAFNILNSREDADECVDDTYMNAWQKIPPHCPSVLSTFLGKITRRVSLNKWKSRTRQKRGGGELPLALDELAECVQSNYSTEKRIEEKELLIAINAFLCNLSEVERDVFVSRYWFLASTKLISNRFGFTEGKVKSILFRTREKLKRHLAEEGLV